MKENDPPCRYPGCIGLAVPGTFGCSRHPGQGEPLLEMLRRIVAGRNRAIDALAKVAEVLRTPHPHITDVIWVDQDPKGVSITLYELVIGALPGDHPERLIAERGGR